MILSSTLLQLGLLDSELIIVLIGVVAIMLVVYSKLIAVVLFKKPLTGQESLIGKKVVATSDVNTASEGEVSVDGIIWKAKLAEGSEIVPKGNSAVVVAVSALTLVIKKSSGQ